MGGGTRRAFIRGKDTMTRPKGHVPLQSAPPLPPAPTAPVFKPPLVTLMTYLPAELLDAVEEVLPALLEQQVHVYLLADRCKTSHVDTFNDKMRRASGEPVPKELRSSVTLGSTAVYIYTSGTTGGCCGTGTCAPAAVSNSLFSFPGLPKAAALSHAKVQVLSLLFSFVGVTSKDVLYTTLPLYHSAGFLGCTSAIESGSLILAQTSARLLPPKVKRSPLCRVQVSRSCCGVSFQPPSSGMTAGNITSPSSSTSGKSCATWSTRRRYVRRRVAASGRIADVPLKCCFLPGRSSTTEATG